MAIKILSSESISGNLTVNGIAQIGASADANFSLGSSGDTFVLTSKKNGTDGIPMIFKVQASGGTIYERINITSGSRTNIDVMSTFASEGIIRIGRYDANISRYNEIKNSVTSNGADSYMKLSVHSGTENVVTDVTTLLGDGNVGIGTDSPTESKLVISGGATGTVGGGDAGITMINKFDNPDNSWSILPVITGVSNTGFSIRDNTDSADRLVIDGSGKVGIGTASPNAKLDVRNNDGNASGLHIVADFNQNGGAGAQMILGYYANGSSPVGPLIYAANGMPQLINASGGINSINLFLYLIISFTSIDLQIYFYRH